MWVRITKFKRFKNIFGDILSILQNFWKKLAKITKFVHFLTLLESGSPPPAPPPGFVSVHSVAKIVKISKIL